MKKLALIFLVLALSVFPVFLTTAAAQANSFCGGVTQKISTVLDENSREFVDLVPTDELFFDEETGLLWMGGLDGGLRVYKPNTHEYETCSLAPKVIDILRAPGGITVATEDGIFTWNESHEEWFEHDTDFVVLDLSVTGQGYILATATDGFHLYDFTTGWLEFDVGIPVPPEVKFTGTEKGTVGEWFFITESSGIIRSTTNRYEWFNQHPEFLVYDGESATWFQPFNFPVTVGSRVSDITLLNNGRLAVASVTDPGITILEFGDPDNPKGYTGWQPGNTYNTSVVSIEPWGDQGYILCGEEGTYLLLQPYATPIVLTGPAHAAADIGNMIFIATDTGTMILR